MGNLFGKKKPVSRITEQDKAVLQLKQQRDKLKQYQKKIERRLESDRELARKLITKGQKDRAKLLLRKKRYQEQLLQKTDGQLENLEKLTQDIEFAQVELQVIDGLKQGNEALKKVNDALSIEDIETILEETREGVEKQQEIDAMLSGVLTQEDEDAVEAELEQIIEESLPNVPKEEMEKDVELPEVPEDEVTIKEKAKEKKKTERVAVEAS